MKNCKNCNQKYDQDLVERMLGKESRPAILGFCSAQCYTLATYTKMVYDSVQMERDLSAVQLILGRLLDYSKLDLLSLCTKAIQEAINSLEEAQMANAEEDDDDEPPEPNMDIFEINDER
jgi:hypothetical protein